jgi:hypothetical protein
MGGEGKWGFLFLFEITFMAEDAFLSGAIIYFKFI